MSLSFCVSRSMSFCVLSRRYFVCLSYCNFVFISLSFCVFLSMSFCVFRSMSFCVYLIVVLCFSPCHCVCFSCHFACFSHCHFACFSQCHFTYFLDVISYCARCHFRFLSVPFCENHYEYYHQGEKTTRSDALLFYWNTTHTHGIETVQYVKQRAYYRKEAPLWLNSVPDHFFSEEAR